MNHNLSKINPGRRSRRAPTVEVLVVALSLALSALAGEAIFRFAAPQPAILFDQGLYIADEAPAYRHRPGFRGILTNVVEYSTRVEINEFGLRGPPLRDEPDLARIVILGDSMVFGQGVEADQAIAARLEARLNEHGQHAEVLNAGVRGYGTVQEAAWLRRYGARLAPRVVVLGVYLGNDLQDNVTPMRDGMRMVVPPQAWHTPVTGFLYAHSHFYRALRAAWYAVGSRTSAEQSAWLSSNYRDANAAAIRDATARALDEIVQVTREMNAQLLAVLIPDAIQVEPARQAKFDEIRRSNPELHLDPAHPNQVFAELLSERHVTKVDLTAAFQGKAKEGASLYIPIDRHWNASGHEFAADLLAPTAEALLQRSVR